MKRQTVSALLSTTIVAAAALLGAACSDDAGGTGTGTSSGLDPSLKIADLSDAERVTLCESSLDGVADSDRQKMACFTPAIQANPMDAAACESAWDTCQTEGTEPIAAVTCDDGDLAMMATCEATVGEAEACFDAMASWYSELAGKLSCSDLSAGQTPPEEPAACVTLNEKCPSDD
jgi:hypothetical protein